MCIWDYIDRNHQQPSPQTGPWRNQHLPHNEFTIGHAAREAGMRSAHFGKWHLGHFAAQIPHAHTGAAGGPAFNLTTPAHCGFDEYYSAMPLFEVSTTFNCGCFDPGNADGQCVEGHWVKPGGCDYMHAGTAADPEHPAPDTTPMVKDGYGADNADLIVSRFEQFANRTVAGGEQFVAALWFQNVHVQYTAVAEFTELYPNATPMQRDFWGSLSALDAAVGRCHRILAALGIARDTIVWFTSDNGPEVGQPGVTRGLVGRKRDFTEGGIRMPTLLEWPAKLATGPHNITAFPAVSNDILPTVLEVLEVNSSHPSWPLDGMSLLPLIADPTLNRRPKPIGHATGQSGDAFPAGFPAGGVAGPRPPPGSTLMQRQFAWTDNDMKLWVHLEGNNTYVYRLYNITADWFEQHDLSVQRPATVASMTEQLMAWYASVLVSSSSAENNCRADQTAGGGPAPAPAPAPMPPSGTVEQNTTNMRGAGSCGKNNTKLGITMIGSFGSWSFCQAACVTHPTLCTTWTWHHPNAASGCYASQCFLRATDVWAPTYDWPHCVAGVRPAVAL